MEEERFTFITHAPADHAETLPDVTHRRNLTLLGVQSWIQQTKLHQFAELATTN